MLLLQSASYELTTLSLQFYLYFVSSLSLSASVLVRSREAHLALPEYPEYETHAAPKGPAPEYHAALKTAAVRIDEAYCQ
jgi:hypothetical protein